MTENKAKLTRVLEVDYELNGTDKTVLTRQFMDIVKMVMNNRMVTGMTPAVVDHYEYKVVDEDNDG